MTKINNFTLVIPTYNRYGKLLRLLDYYNSFAFPFQIIILDSSTDKNKPNKLTTYLENENLKYLVFDSDILVGDKICIGVSKVKTHYSALCADDDFIVPSAIHESINFLEINYDYVVCQGCYTSFIENPSFTSEIEWKKTYPLRSIEQKLASDRVLNYLSDYSMSIFYGVYRLEVLRSGWEAVSQKTNDDRFGELLPAMLAVIAGKIKTLNILYSARQLDQLSGGYTSPTMQDFKHNNTYQSKFYNFKSCLVSNLQNQESISNKKAGKIIEIAMKRYLNNKTFRAKVKKIIESLVIFNRFIERFREKELAYFPIEYSNPANLSNIDFLHLEMIIKAHYVKNA